MLKSVAAELSASNVACVGFALCASSAVLYTPLRRSCSWTRPFKSSRSPLNPFAASVAFVSTSLSAAAASSTAALVPDTSSINLSTGLSMTSVRAAAPAASSVPKKASAVEPPAIAALAALVTAEVRTLTPASSMLVFSPIKSDTNSVTPVYLATMLPIWVAETSPPVSSVVIPATTVSFKPSCRFSHPLPSIIAPAVLLTPSAISVTTPSTVSSIVSPNLLSILSAI